MKVTIKDIAEKAGVAYSTVSRIVNGTGNFSQETIDRVNKIIIETGYIKNKNASELVIKQKSNVIGLVMPLHHTNFTDNVINGIHSELIKKKFELLITYAESYNEKSQYKAAATLIERGVSGIVILSMTPFDSVKKVVINQNVPFIVLGMHIDDESVTSLDFDEYQVGYTAADYLVKKGHKRIAFIGLELKEHNITSEKRLQGYKDVLKNHQIAYDPDLIKNGSFSYEDGLSAKTLIHSKEAPTAYIGASDLVTISLLKVMIENGLSVPNDISLLSIDGTEITKYVSPTITSVKLPFEQLGKGGINQLINKINDESPLVDREFAVTVQEGQSVMNKM